jgi:hypothetical protein
MVIGKMALGPKCLKMLGLLKLQPTKNKHQEAQPGQLALFP